MIQRGVRRIAAPVVGGMLTEVSVVFVMLPPLYAWWRKRSAMDG